MPQPTGAPRAWDAPQAVGERLARSMKPADKSLGRLFLDEVVPALQEKAEAEERRRRAAERVRSRLGVAVEAEDLTGRRSRRERRQARALFAAAAAAAGAAVNSAAGAAALRAWAPAAVP